MSIKRTLAAFAVAGLASAVVTAPASADPTPSGDAGSSWLIGELNDDDLIVNAEFEFEDYGLTIDTALAAAAAETDAAKVDDIADAIAANVESYISFDGDTFANATAKALAFAQLAGRDGTDFGGVDLVETLEGLVLTDAPNAGRISDDSAGTDFASTIGQAFAAQALAEAESELADEALDFLLAQQCSDGFFRLSFSPEVSPLQSCDEAVPAASGSVDTTAIASTSLFAVGTPEARASLFASVPWLLSVQNEDGSFGTDGTGEGANSNSTGLAAAVLDRSCQAGPAIFASRWMRDLQVGAEEAGTPLEGEEGAIAFDQAALDAGVADGITASTRDQWRRASAQAVTGLGFDAEIEPTVTLTVPRYAQADRPVRLRISGADEGERVCVIGAGRIIEARGNGGTIGPVLPGAADGEAGVYYATTGAGIDGERVTFLGAKRFDLRKRGSVKRGAFQRVVVRGLAPRESVSIKVRGNQVASGRANGNGLYIAKFRVQTKKGKANVKAIGEFRNRRAVESFIVRP